MLQKVLVLGAVATRPPPVCVSTHVPDQRGVEHASVTEQFPSSAEGLSEESCKAVGISREMIFSCCPSLGYRSPLGD